MTLPDLDGNKVTYRIAEEKEVYNLDLVESDVTEYDLIRWLDMNLRDNYLSQAIRIRFIDKTIRHLIADKGFTLTSLVRSKFLLVKAIQKRLALLRERASAEGFQKVLFEDAVPLEVSASYTFDFKPGIYPARPPFYSGRYKFSKHYYLPIEDLKVDGEEFSCAQAIDANTKVKYWVRNLVQRDAASFRLPLANGWFYPDFVAELTDGRMLVIEYKGDAYKTNDDSRDKNNVGKLWAEKGGENCLFLMAVMQDELGKNVYQQLDAVLE